MPGRPLAGERIARVQRLVLDAQTRVVPPAVTAWRGPDLDPRGTAAGGRSDVVSDADILNLCTRRQSAASEPVHSDVRIVAHQLPDDECEFLRILRQRGQLIGGELVGKGTLQPLVVCGWCDVECLGEAGDLKGDLAVD